MNKSTHFFEQFVFGQLISLIDKKIIIDLVNEYRYGFNGKESDFEVKGAVLNNNAFVSSFG